MDLGKAGLRYENSAVISKRQGPDLSSDEVRKLFDFEFLICDNALDQVADRDDADHLAVVEQVSVQLVDGKRVRFLMSDSG